MYEYFKMKIGGCDQQVLISGDESKPVLIFCHGGPGTPTMSFIKKWNRPLLDMFLVVTWDQRGTGRSFNKTVDPKTINFQTIQSDVLELTKYIQKRFNREKIFIMGHSFGATLALDVIKKWPENFYGYFSVSQFVNTVKNEDTCYDFVMETALKLEDHRAIKKLRSIGPPNKGYYKRPVKDLMTVRQFVSKYKGDMKQKNSSIGILIRIMLSKEYGFLRVPNTMKGISISLSQVGMSLRDIAYDETHTKLEVPVYFMSGDYDQLTPQKILREYYETITAPQKNLYIFTESAHSPLWEEPDKFHNLIREIMEKDFVNAI